jgi:hypothetical protein
MRTLFKLAPRGHRNADTHSPSVQVSRCGDMSRNGMRFRHSAKNERVRAISTETVVSSNVE